MMASDINRLMSESDTWKRQENTDARHAFIRIMRPRQYGQDALWSAWSWFLMGWNGGQVTPVSADEDGERAG